jgi:hypothetical protein
MKLKMISICLIFVIIFISCKKEPLLVVGNSEVLLLSKVLTDNQPSNEYLYNDLNLIIEEKSKFDFTSYHYNGKGQLVTAEFYSNDDILSNDLRIFQTAMNSNILITQANGKKVGTITYEYNNNGELIKTTYTGLLAGSTEYSEFTYDSNNRISKQTMYWGNTAMGYIDYSYDIKGNLIKEILYNLPSTGVAELITSTRYDFDNKQNPYRSFKQQITPGINTNQNNIIKETYTIHLTPEQGSDKEQITETSYIYIANGYPTGKNGNVVYVYK